MEYIWIIVIFVVVFKMLWRLVERFRDPGGLDGPWGGPLPGRDGFPRRRDPAGEQGASRPKLNIPEYLTRRSGSPAAGETAPEPAVEGAVKVAAKHTAAKEAGRGFGGECRAEPAVLPGCPRGELGEDTPRQHAGRHRKAGLFNGEVGPGCLLEGVVWSEILGPRGGLRARRAMSRKNLF
ncbi:MAG: hypothetical protein K6T29_03165 [Peptococcaceae bacterium]|nr:hypothetical protein [Peptococcaceae bacterium]